MGVGGSLSGPFQTPFELGEDVMASILERTHMEIDVDNPFVLVSHSPPINTKVDVVRWGTHVGSRAIRSFVEEKKPQFSACGHIHEARGVDEINNIPIINPGPAMWGFCSFVEVKNQIIVKLDSLV